MESFALRALADRVCTRLDDGELQTLLITLIDRVEALERSGDLLHGVEPLPPRRIPAWDHLDPEERLYLGLDF